MRIRPEFLRALSQTVDLARLEESRHTIFGMTPELRLVYYNPAWLEFAASSGAPRMAESWPLGRAVLAAVPPVLRSFYLDGYAQALATGRPWETEYLAPTPHRSCTFVMSVLPVGARAGLLVTNRLLTDEPHAAEVHAADERRYRQTDGALRQCASCRDFAAAQGAPRWNRVPAWLAVPPVRVVGALCPECAARHHPSRARAA